MLVISLCNQKGGVSKSTNAMALARCALRDLRLPTFVVDFDPQATSLKILALARSQGGVDLPTPVNVLPTGEGIAFVDTPGLDKDTTIRAAKLADVIIIPTGASTQDLDAALLTVAFCKRHKKQTCWLPSRMHPSVVPGGRRGQNASKHIGWSLTQIMEANGVAWPILPGIRDLSGAANYIRGVPERENEGNRKGVPKFEHDVKLAWAALRAIAGM
jgi:hypothetical protein